MPTLDQLRSSTTPIVIHRGNVTFTLHCALEKLDSENDEYQKLKEARAMLDVEAGQLRARWAAHTAMIDVLQNDQTFRNFLILEQTGKPATPEALKAHSKRVNAEALRAEANKRAQEADTQLDEIKAEFERIDKAQIQNLATRLAYLVVSSDIEDGGKDVLSGKVEKTEAEMAADIAVFKTFTPILLEHCVHRVEAAVYGPLVTPAS